MKRVFVTGLTLVLATALTTSAHAQRDSRDAEPDTRDDRYEMDRQDMEPAGQTNARIHRIQGTISEMFSARYLGHQEPHVLARLQHQEGWSAVVDLGPKSQLAKLNLDEGDPVTVVGAPGRINDRPVFFATRIHAKQEMVTVDRSEVSGMMKLRGTIEDTRSVRYENVDSTHLVVKFRSDNDRVALLDLGAASQFKDVSLEPDTPVQVVVTPGTIGGRRAFFVQDLRINGERVEVTRSSMDVNLEVASDSPYDPAEERAQAETGTASEPETSDD